MTNNRYATGLATFLSVTKMRFHCYSPRNFFNIHGDVMPELSRRRTRWEVWYSTVFKYILHFHQINLGQNARAIKLAIKLSSTYDIIIYHWAKYSLSTSLFVKMNIKSERPSNIGWKICFLLFIFNYEFNYRLRYPYTYSSSLS